MSGLVLIFTILFCSHNNSEIAIIIYILLEKHESLDKLNNLSKVIQLVNGRAGIQI